MVHLAQSPDQHDQWPLSSPHYDNTAAVASVYVKTDRLLADITGEMHAND